MDKQEAMNRLDAIEREAKALREIIEGEKIVFDGNRIYVATKTAESPYILLGGSCEEKGFYSLEDTEYRMFSLSSGQECIDKAIRYGYTIRRFSNTREALTFFLENL